MSGSGQDERTSVLSGMEAGLHLICAKIKASRSLFEGLVLEPHLFGCHSSLPWSQEVGLGVNESSQRARGACTKSGRLRRLPRPPQELAVSRSYRPESPLSSSLTHTHVSPQLRQTVMATADAPAAAAVAKAKYLKHNNPPGIFFKDTDKDLYQSLILGEYDQGKRVRITRPIPGVFKGVDAAVEAQAAAQLKWDSGEVVWPAPPATALVITLVAR